MLIYSFIADYQAFSLRYKDNTTRDKNETKVGKQSANLGKNNEPIQNRLSFLIDCKSVILHHLTILSFPMVRPAWDNWWLLVVAENTCSEMGGIVGAHVYDFHIAVVFGCCNKIRLYFQGIGRRGKAVTDVYAAVVICVLYGTEHLFRQHVQKRILFLSGGNRRLQCIQLFF